jgi:hypothetical protein
MEALHTLLKAQFNICPAGHWVVFEDKVVGVKLMAIVYKWSQKVGGGGACIMISTFGSMQIHEIKYLSTFEDKYGNIDHKEINHPQVCHFLYDYLPLIDKHNKQR